MKNIKQLGLAVAVAITLIAGNAAPASATDHLVDVTGGYLRTILGDFDLTPGSQGTPPCPDEPTSLDLTTGPTDDGPPPTGLWNLSGGFTGQFQFPPWSGNWYLVDFYVLLGSGGTWTGEPPTQELTGTIAIQASIYYISNWHPCWRDNLQCSITAVFGLAATSTYESFGPGLPDTEVGDQITIDATTLFPLQVGSPCAPPWNSAAGTSATLDGLQLTLI